MNVRPSASSRTAWPNSMQVELSVSVLYQASSSPVTVTRARSRSRTGVGAMSVNSRRAGTRSPAGAWPPSVGACRWMWPIAPVPSRRRTSVCTPSLTTVIEWATTRIDRTRSARVGCVARALKGRIRVLQRRSGNPNGYSSRSA
ncbi:hypothetical protein SMICM304S_02932 [Streptomyces microflavus]